MTPDTRQVADILTYDGVEVDNSFAPYVDKVEYVNRGFLTIGEIIKLTGVTKATVHHYVSLKVLPPPVKTAHNMAYYHPDSVSVIKVIRTLRDRHVPLSVVKQLLDEYGIEKVKEMIRKTLEESLLAVGTISDSGNTRSKESMLSTSGLEESEISDLENLGLIKFTKNGDYDSLSVDLIECLTAMRNAGLNESVGFRPKDIVLYQTNLEQLVKDEIAYFSERIFSLQRKYESVALMEAALEHAENICILVRRRILLNSLDYDPGK